MPSLRVPLWCPPNGLIVIRGVGFGARAWLSASVGDRLRNLVAVSVQADQRDHRLRSVSARGTVAVIAPLGASRRPEGLVIVKNAGSGVLADPSPRRAVALTRTNTIAGFVGGGENLHL